MALLGSSVAETASSSVDPTELSGSGALLLCYVVACGSLGGADTVCSRWPVHSDICAPMSHHTMYTVVAWALLSFVRTLYAYVTCSTVHLIYFYLPPPPPPPSPLPLHRSSPPSQWRSPGSSCTARHGPSLRQARPLSETTRSCSTPWWRSVATDTGAPTLAPYRPTTAASVASTTVSLSCGESVGTGGESAGCVMCVCVCEYIAVVLSV